MEEGARSRDFCTAVSRIVEQPASICILEDKVEIKVTHTTQLIHLESN
jgi:hypothetical protein